MQSVFTWATAWLLPAINKAGRTINHAFIARPPIYELTSSDDRAPVCVHIWMARIRDQLSARGRPIIVEWERRKAFGGLSRSVTHRNVTERYTFS
ncbi:hypothetical protein EVAR_5700_1 [Eumeta japonica]|uniref:Uncharacterized protein n=1 Tax=Eumeta variegata TaxID=151549 RepID=A0A4C1T9Z1_EUMVA|nr:hypothetical protein EVAR_5700_1 [Eumeta japonica]